MAAMGSTAAETTTQKPPIDGEQVEGQLQARHHATWLAMRHHWTHKGERFDYGRYPYVRKPLDDAAQVIVVKKSTQGGWTEMLLIKAMSAMMRGLQVFWVLPTDVIKGRFVKNRFDRSVAYTPEYQRYASGEETQVSRFNPAASMSLKHFGQGAVAFVGSNSMAGFGEFPADVGVVDEYDYCDQTNLPMVEERLSNSEQRIRWLVGNPTISGVGISQLYKESDRRRWMMRHDCGLWLSPQWKLHVVREIDELSYEVRDDEWEGPNGPDARLICERCGKAIDRYRQGRWVAEEPGQAMHGYHVNKLFSTRMTVNEMIERFNRGLVDPNTAQRFWNGDMGEAYSAPGAHLGPEDLQAALGDWGNGARATGACFAGIDVGAVLHVAVGMMTPDDGVMRVVWLGTMPGRSVRETLADLAARGYAVRMGIIDERPETRFSRRLAAHRAWAMCRYVAGKRDVIDRRTRIAAVDRTVALDAVVEAVRLGALRLPADALGVPDFVEHMQALTRVYDAEKNGGEGAYEWRGDQPDHFMHSLAYLLLARRVIAGR